MRRYILSKLAKTSVLVSHPIVARYIPKTVLFQRDSLAAMLDQFRMVYVKPDIGTYGKGVMKVESHAPSHSSSHPQARSHYHSSAQSGTYSYQIGTKKHKFERFETLYEALRKEIKNKIYVIQKGIRLRKYEGYPYDIRVMVQKTPAHHWETTGLIGRVAAPQKIVTNFHSGGRLIDIAKLIAQGYSPQQQLQLKNKLKQLGLQIASTLAVRYPGIREIGIDIGLDQKWKPWIFEINTAPDPYIFKTLRNRKMYQKIIRYFKFHKR